MKSTELMSVTLRGRCIGLKTRITFTRHDDKHWQVDLKCGDKTHRGYVDKNYKPCWTIAVAMVEDLWKPKAVPRRSNPDAPKTPPQLKVVG